MYYSDKIALTTRLTSDGIDVGFCSFGLNNKTYMLTGYPSIMSTWREDGGFRKRTHSCGWVWMLQGGVMG